MFAQNIPCKSSGSEAIESAMAWCNPAWERPGKIEPNTLDRKLGEDTDVAWIKDNFRNRETFI